MTIDEKTALVLEGCGLRGVLPAEPAPATACHTCQAREAEQKPAPCS